MNLDQLRQMYDFTGKTIAITGGAGILGREITRTMLDCNATVYVIQRDVAKSEKELRESGITGDRLKLLQADVLNQASVLDAINRIVQDAGHIGFLINAAGGNNPKATTNPSLSFFDLPAEALRLVFDLNVVGTIIPTQVVAKHMAGQKEGIILNVTSMAAFRPLTRVGAYSAAKAAVSNFTQWLAVHMAQEYSPNIRVNAIAPGFFLTQQNRFLLTDEKTGALSERGKKIIDHTPMGRFGAPADLIGATLWLLSPASEFVTGIVVPIDGGFSAYSGV
jgi:NAD(P)-dependent dehydrogenase (short-subunit alcohol dehydrogenase family)